jgi:hypothetical protein
MQYFKKRFRFGRFIAFVSTLIVFFLFLAFGVSGQTTTDSLKIDSTKSYVNSFIGVTIVSQNVWRGIMLDNKPNIQPVFGLEIGNFEIGAFGTVSLVNSYSEVDLYASCSLKNMKIILTDLYIDLSGTANNQNYFDYSDTSVHHHIMCDLMFLGTESIPLQITASTMLHSGWDLYGSGKKRYTTYLEARYLYKEWEMFVGAFSGGSNFYINDANGINIGNVGVAYNYEIEINDKFKLPTMAQVCVNPKMKKLYFTLGVTF